MDRYFYSTVSKILEFKGLDSVEVLKSLGYYNKSIFVNKIYGLLLSFFVVLSLYILYRLYHQKKARDMGEKIRNLEEDLIKINNGDYSLEIKEDDEYSLLRDEIYRVIVNLKSLEEESKRQKISLKKDLSNIAHHLKTPITSMGFMLELIEEDGDNSEIYKIRFRIREIEKFYRFSLKIIKSKFYYNRI